MAEHQFFTVEATATTINVRGALAIYCGDAPRHNEDGSTTYSLRAPLLIMPPDMWADAEGVAAKVADLLNAHAHLFFDAPMPPPQGDA